MSHIIQGILCIAVGIAIIVFRKGYTQHIAQTQKDLFKFHYGKREVAMSEVGLLVLGITAVIFGLLLIFGFVTVKA